MDSSPSDPRKFLPLSRPTLGSAEAEAVARVLGTGWVSQGPEVAAFETEFAAAVGAPYACAVANGTTALHLALLAVGVTPGDEVITVSSSYIASAASVCHCGALPVFVDVEPLTGNLDPRLLEAAVSPTTRAILCVHQLGMPCELEAILGFARAHGLAVVEDAACAAGSQALIGNAWEPIGRPHGDVACFSFHGRKLLTTGEGGMITTRSPTIDRRVRSARQHGMSLAADQRHSAKQVEFEVYTELGFNDRMSDVQAAIGREQLRRLNGIVERRRALAQRYADVLHDLPWVSAPGEPSWARNNWQSYPIRLAAGVAQRALMQALLDDGIATRRGVMCCHREPAFPFRSWRCGARAQGCPPESGRCPHLAVSELIQDRVILAPLYPEMDDADPERVAAALERHAPRCLEAR
jgi:perosamine synthetase